MTYLTDSEAKAEALAIIMSLLLRARLNERDRERLRDDADGIAKKIGLQPIRDEVAMLFERP